jgi:hypothetical protein
MVEPIYPKIEVAILAGDANELLKSQELQGIVQRAGKDWPVQLPGIGHIPLTLDKAALNSARHWYAVFIRNGSARAFVNQHNRLSGGLCQSQANAVDFALI